MRERDEQEVTSDLTRCAHAGEGRLPSATEPLTPRSQRCKRPN